MLYQVIVSGEDVSYVPTALGKGLLVFLFLALLVAAVLTARRKSPAPKGTSGRLTARQLAFCAAAIALGTVLSNVKLYRFPFGGSVTLLSMLFICLPGYWFGLEAGLATGVAYGILQVIIDPYVIHPVQLLVDYPLAFGAFGLSGIFAGRRLGLIKGYLAGIAGRWVFTTLSGWIFFAEYAWEGWAPLPYSLVYNGIYIFSEGAVTLLILAVPHVREALGRVKKLALEGG